MRARHAMRPGRTVWALLGLCLLGANVPQTLAQVGPEESARRIKPAEGLEASLWASEPLLVNPTNIDIDSRGRVWVTEGLNYRLSRLGNARFHRIEDADKIKILEDTDGDGKADKATVFADRVFPVPMGIAVEEHFNKEGRYTGCRVFVGNSPDLLVLEDTDGDDKADKRYPLLSGFGGIDSDHGVHGMVLGLDGKLYFTHGDGCCSVQQDKSERPQNFDVVDKSGRRVKSDQLANTLRVNRDGTEFEVICDRQRNNYETSRNSFGNLFTSDNDDDGNRGCRVIWALDGGHFGYRTPGSPRHWGEDVPGNVPKLAGTGNGSPAGIMVYEGDLLPREYYGSVLEVDAGTRQVNFFPITRTGASFQTQYKVFLTSDDPWFRPIDACAAPDGSVFVADWYDAGVGGHAFSDQTTGRIYRVSTKGEAGRRPSPKADFGTIEGLIEALKSPNISTQDAARRGLIAWGAPAGQAVHQLAHDGRSEHQARALWVASALPPEVMFKPLLAYMKEQPEAFRQHDPRLRELVVRILGRDCRENGSVEYKDPAAKRPPAALAHLDALLALADDPDAGVRRELILALRNVPTAQAGDALRKLIAAWDGVDRWYLEALGLAIEKRESEYLASLFTNSPFGDLSEQDLDRQGEDVAVALPPYFPVDRNEAYITVGTPEPRASALSKSLGLAWRLRRAEVIPLLRKIVHHLRAPGLQQAADDVLRQLHAPEACVLVAEMIGKINDPVRQRELLTILGKNLEGKGRVAKDDAVVHDAVTAALSGPETRSQGIAIVAASRDARYDQILESIAKDENLPAEERVAAVQALGEIHGPIIHFLDQMITAAHGKPQSSPVADAAVRTVGRIYDARTRLTELVAAPGFPLGLRREALRALAEHQDGGQRILELARSKALPADLTTEAVSLLLTHRDRKVRDKVATVLPVPTIAGGRPLPPVAELIRREGDAQQGREIFFRNGLNACASCHRVRGQGQWVGPDLSTIGTKYGKDELLLSILNPSAAVGYTYRPLVLGLTDGRIITGLAVEESADRLVVKTADGQRIAIRSAEIEDRRTSELSLMPEGLAGSLTDQELVNLLTYLSTLREPVSIVGQYHVVGPVPEPNGEPIIDTAHKLDLAATVAGSQGRILAWRRLDANAEGLADLTPLVATDSRQAVYAYTQVTSPIEQTARLAVDCRSDLTIWFNGKPLVASSSSQANDVVREFELKLPSGPSQLLIRLAGGGRAPGQASLVTTIISGQPVSFSGTETSLSAR